MRGLKLDVLLLVVHADVSHPIWVCGLKQRKKSDFYSSKAPLRIAMSLVVNDFVSIDFVVQYSAKENGYMAI